MTQKICKVLGEGGCYFLSLLHLANQEDRAIYWYKRSVDEGWIDEECYLWSPVGLLKALFDVSYTVTISEKIDKDADFIIAKYKNETYCHYVVVDKKGNVIWDPLEKSNTVKNGKVVDYRIIKR